MLFPISLLLLLITTTPQSTVGSPDYITTNEDGASPGTVVSKPPKPGNIKGPANCPDKYPDPDPYPICVVGGGITGLVVANILEDADRNVVVFEKSGDHIGGKLETLNTWEAVWEKGPVLFSSGEEALFKYLNKYNQTPPPQWHGENVGLFNPNEAKPRQIPAEIRDNMKAHRDVILQTYTKIWNHYPSWLFESRGFEHVHLLTKSHPDLFLNTKDWLARYGLSEMEWAFGVIFTCEGYGNIKDLPALYMLRLLFPKVLEDLFDLLSDKADSKIGIFTHPTGFGDLASEMAKDLNCLYMANEVTLVDRSQYERSGIVRLVADVGKGHLTHERNCSKVVLAFPPLLSKLVRMIPDLDLFEKSTLGRVKVHKYFSSGHILHPEPKKHVYLGSEKDKTSGKEDWLLGDGNPIALVRSGKGHKDYAYTIYSWIYGRYDGPPKEEDYILVNTYLRKFLTTFSRDTPKVSFLEGYEYFPHVNRHDMADGWFSNFSSIQGNKGVFIASPVTSFESVSTSIDNAEAVADLILHS